MTGFEKLAEHSEDFATTPISKIRPHLERLLGAGWESLELETISLELGFILSPLLRNKISVLKILRFQPELFFTDLLFFLHSSEAINDMDVDFDHVPHLTSLEIAFAIGEVKALTPPEVHGLSEEVAAYINYILNEEGYSVPTPFFQSVPGLKLHPGQTEEDSNNKTLAIKAYILAKTSGKQ